MVDVNLSSFSDIDILYTFWYSYLCKCMIIKAFLVYI